MRKAFTLIEVNLAMLIMAGGILSIVGLYAFGFRESRQGREDVAAAAFADAVVSPLVMALSETNLAWSTFSQQKFLPGDDGWGEYLNSDGVVSENPLSKAQSTYSATLSWAKSCGAKNLYENFPSESLGSRNLYAGLVVMHEKDSAVVSIGFRATDKASTLMSMPLFFTQVRFQGDPNK